MHVILWTQSIFFICMKIKIHCARNKKFKFKNNHFKDISHLNLTRKMSLWYTISFYISQYFINQFYCCMKKRNQKGTTRKKRDIFNFIEFLFNEQKLSWWDKLKGTLIYFFSLKKERKLNCPKLTTCYLIPKRNKNKKLQERSKSDKCRHIQKGNLSRCKFRNGKLFSRTEKIFVFFNGIETARKANVHVEKCNDNELDLHVNNKI